MIDFIAVSGAKLKKKIRQSFSLEFRLETAQLVVDQSYTKEEAAKAMGVGKSANQ